MIDWMKTWSIMATIAGSAYYIHRELKTEIRCVRDEIKAQSARTDKLYKIFIDLIKEGRK